MRATTMTMTAMMMGNMFVFGDEVTEEGDEVTEAGVLILLVSKYSSMVFVKCELLIKDIP